MIINFYPDDRDAYIWEEGILLATLKFVGSKEDVENILSKFSLKLRTRWRKSGWGYTATCVNKYMIAKGGRQDALRKN